MSKILGFTLQEQKKLEAAFKTIALILSDKKSEGFNMPKIKSNLDFVGEDYKCIVSAHIVTKVKTQKPSIIDRYGQI